MGNDLLVERVLQEIISDIEYNDYTAIYELLKFIPKENLIGFLPEEEWSKY